MNDHGVVSLCQFRDYIVLASTYPPEVQLVRTVCHILEECWGLRVVCHCDSTCTTQCLKPTVQAMGYGLQRARDGRGTAHLQSSLTDTCNRKLGPPLCTAGTQPKRCLTSIFSSVLASSVPWCETWAGQLLSTMSWCQVAVLSGYDRKHEARSMHSTIQRVYGDTVHSSDLTATSVHHTVPLLPLPRVLPRVEGPATPVMPMGKARHTPHGPPRKRRPQTVS